MISFSLRSKAEHAANIIPDLKTLALRSAYHVLNGQHAQRKSGSGEAFWQFREYQVGDMPRDIDWRQSAKGERVFIRQSEQHKAQQCLFWVKRNADMGFVSDDVEHSKRTHAAVMALALALLHSRGGEMIGFAGLQSVGHSEKALQTFEQLVQTEDEVALPASFDVPKHANFYGMSDFLEPLADIEAAFAPLVARTQNGMIVQVLDPAELDLPYSGRVMFEDMRGDDRALISNAVDIREAYAARIAAHNAGLRALCAKWGWVYVLHNTRMPFEDTLMNIWREGQV